MSKPGSAVQRRTPDEHARRSAQTRLRSLFERTTPNVFGSDGRITEAGLAASNATLVDPPAVAIGLAGQGKTRGTAALVNTPVCTNQSIALIKGRTGVLDTGYLFHNLDGRYDELRTRSAGGGRAGLSRGILAKIPIALPDLPEQTRIAAAMDTLDETIANIL
ncbi:MAG: hypothetical protein DMG10_00465 [Acidobacteria bacterium]|nr:MAG: hypothetical protein DMG10_00465 [Acidobacteriota bacterium]